MSTTSFIPGDEAFFAFHNRIYSGRIIHTGDDYVQVKTPVASKLSRQWYSICFYTSGPRKGEAFTSPMATLLTPSGFAQRAEWVEQADLNNRDAERDALREKQEGRSSP